MNKLVRTLIPQRRSEISATNAEKSTENTIERVSSQLLNGGFAGMMQPKEQQLIVAELKACQDKKIVETATCRVQADAERAVVEIGLQSEELRERILLCHNQRAGNLYRQHQALVTRSMSSVIENETLDQELLSRSEVSDEDRAMLEEFIRQQASEELLGIAKTNAINISEHETPAENAR